MKTQGNQYTNKLVWSLKSSSKVLMEKPEATPPGPGLSHRPAAADPVPAHRKSSHRLLHLTCRHGATARGHSGTGGQTCGAARDTGPLRPVYHVPAGDSSLRAEGVHKGLSSWMDGLGITRHRETPLPWKALLRQQPAPPRLVFPVALTECLGSACVCLGTRLHRRPSRVSVETLETRKADERRSHAIITIRSQ